MHAAAAGDRQCGVAGCNIGPLGQVRDGAGHGAVPDCGARAQNPCLIVPDEEAARAARAFQEASGHLPA